MKNQDASGLYLLQDGTHAAPGDCSKGKDGVLRHENGLAVAMDADGKPQTVGEDAERNMNVEAAKTGDDTIAARNAEEAKDRPRPATASHVPERPFAPSMKPAKKAD